MCRDEVVRYSCIFSVCVYEFSGSRGSGMGPAHCLSVSSSGKMCLEIPHTKRRGPPTKFSSWCSLIFPFSSRHQYHPGSFGGASVHVRSRGMAFHAATAASSVFLMGPLSAHPMYLHMTNATPVPFVLVIPAECLLHAGHGSNVSSSDRISYSV